jgi:hypothetical protein
LGEGGRDRTKVFEVRGNGLSKKCLRGGGIDRAKIVGGGVTDCVKRI